KDKELEIKRKEIRDVKEQLIELKREVENKEKVAGDIEYYKTRVNDLEREREELKNELDNTCNQKGKLNNQLKNSRIKYQKLVRQKRKVDTHLRNVRGTKKNLNNQLSFFQTECVDLEQAGLGLLTAYYQKEKELGKLQQLLAQKEGEL